jgi:hypothetical protein
MTMTILARGVKAYGALIQCHVCCALRKQRKNTYESLRCFRLQNN